MGMLSYAGKLALAPMVRAGELPTRLLALKNGADLVWGPEIVDKKLIQCRRVVNEALKTIDFVVPSNDEKKPPVVVFRTCRELEKGKLVFQLGTAVPDLAVEAAKVVVGDVDAIDVNAGCPKHFSIHSGMGAALLQVPDTLCNILSALVDRVGKPNNKPISVKIRLLHDKKSTLELVQKICDTGITNLTVHCRTTPMRNREAPIRDYLSGIYQICQSRNVSLIMNGALRNRQDFLQVRDKLGLGSDVGGMIAEEAEANATVFSENPIPWHKAVKEYLKIAEEYANHTSNTKYMLGRMVPGKSLFYQYFIRCKKMEQFLYVADTIDDEGKCSKDPLEYLEQSNLKEKAAKAQVQKMKKSGRDTNKRPLEGKEEDVKRMKLD